MINVYALDLLGTFAFAVYGSYVAIEKDFDILGVILCALLCGLGGGTLRELMLNNVPFYFYDNNYIFAVIAGTIFTTLTFRIFARVNTFMLFMDAIGLVTFAYIGAFTAVNKELGMFAVILFAAMTAAGGGIMRDIVIRELPRTLYADFYTIPAALLGFVYWLFPAYQSSLYFVYSILLFFFAIRVVSICHTVQVWKPQAWALHLKFWKPLYVGEKITDVLRKSSFLKHIASVLNVLVSGHTIPEENDVFATQTQLQFDGYSKE